MKERIDACEKIDSKLASWNGTYGKCFLDLHVCGATISQVPTNRVLVVVYPPVIAHDRTSACLIASTYIYFHLWCVHGICSEGISASVCVCHDRKCVYGLLQRGDIK
jgi:hypothetical protein